MGIDIIRPFCVGLQLKVSDTNGAITPFSPQLQYKNEKYKNAAIRVGACPLFKKLRKKPIMVQILCSCDLHALLQNSYRLFGRARVFSVLKAMHQHGGLLRVVWGVFGQCVGGVSGCVLVVGWRLPCCWSTTAVFPCPRRPSLHGGSSAM